MARTRSNHISLPERRNLPLYADDRTSRILTWIDPSDAMRKLRLRQAVRCDMPGMASGLRLLDSAEHARAVGACYMRGSHTGRKNMMLAAIGMSQCYTTSNVRGAVDGFKLIVAEDLPVFHAATRGNFDV